MGVKKYKYSDGQMLFDIALLLFIALFAYMSLIGHNADYRSWLFLWVILLMILSRFIYVAIMYLIPWLKGKTALELDEDKWQLFIKGKLLFQIPRDVTYWSDINDIEFISPPRGSAVINFNMNDGTAFGFRTKYIAGNDKDIYNTIIEYFQKKSSSVGN